MMSRYNTCALAGLAAAPAARAPLTPLRAAMTRTDAVARPMAVACSTAHPTRPHAQDPAGSGLRQLQPSTARITGDATGTGAARAVARGAPMLAPVAAGGADGDMPWLSAHLPPDGAEHDDPQFRNDGQSRPRQLATISQRPSARANTITSTATATWARWATRPHTRGAPREIPTPSAAGGNDSPGDNLPPPDEDSWDRGDRGDEDGREESHGGRGHAERAPPMQARPPAHAPSPPSGSGGGRPHRRMGGLAAQARAQAAARHHGGESSPGPSYDEPHDEPPPRRPQQRHMDTHDDYNYDDRHRHPDDGYDDNPRDETYRRRRDQQQRDEPPPYHPSGAGVAADDNFADEDWDDDDI